MVLWEQTLTIFDDVLLKNTAHAQLGHQHTGKSWKAKKECTVKRVLRYVVRMIYEQFLNFSWNWEERLR